jgi:hypothetical protein
MPTPELLSPSVHFKDPEICMHLAFEKHGLQENLKAETQPH